MSVLSLLNPFLVDSFAGFLCSMGLVAGQGLRDEGRSLSAGVLAFAIVMPLIGAVCAAALSPLVGVSPGGTAILITLAASASYIAVPAAMRMALPEANPAIALSLSLGVTFPFNLMFGIPCTSRWLSGSAIPERGRPVASGAGARPGVPGNTAR